MRMESIVLAAFFVLTLSAAGKPSREAPPRTFYLGDRKLGPLGLFLTTAATNFSAFTVLGLSGAGYRIGYAFYPAMGLATGFMAIGWYLAAEPLRQLGGPRGWVTAADFVRERYGSPAVQKAYAAFLVLHTLPYLALQPMAAGYLLEAAFGVPYAAGALGTAAVVACYTLSGGFGAVVRTDAAHAFVLAATAAVGWGLAAGLLGGPREAHRAVAAAAPALLGRPGGGQGIGPVDLAGYFVLWFLANPVFPQLSQRAFAASSARSIAATAAAYPLATTGLFFLTVGTGVFCSVLLPGLGAAGSDRAWPALAALASAETGWPGRLAAALMLLAPLAAIMTTMDSQLLSATSLVVRDLFGRKDGRGRLDRLALVAIAAAGAALSLRPPRSILDFLNASSFLGYAALSPVVLGGLYAPRIAGPAAPLAAIAAGQVAAALAGSGLFRIPGIPAVFPVAGVAWGAYFAAAAAERALRGPSGSGSALSRRLRDALPPRWAAAFAAVVLPSFLYGSGGAPGPAGIPVWVWTAVAQGAVLSVLLAAFFRRKPVPGASRKN